MKTTTANTAPAVTLHIVRDRRNGGGRRSSKAIALALLGHGFDVLSLRYAGAHDTSVLTVDCVPPSPQQSVWLTALVGAVQSLGLYHVEVAGVREHVIHLERPQAVIDAELERIAAMLG